MAHRFAASILYASLACGTSPTEIADPVRQPADASVSSTEAPPLPAVAKPTAPAPKGWFRSDDLCLELFANGDFELAVMDDRKVLVVGAAKLVSSGEHAFTAELSVQRIWKARYVGPCRRTHESGEFIEERAALGRSFTPGATTRLELKIEGDDHIELCGEQCTKLVRDTPALGSRWRAPGLENASDPKAAFAPDDLLEIDIEATTYTAHLWAAKDAKSWNDPGGAMTVEYRGDDRFAITFTPGEYGELAGGARVLGEPLERGKPVAFIARRLPNERLEVCTTPKRCATLDRQFDSGDYEIR